ncbi:hypothetical protein AB1Y20_009602 [Prymnesium parvum]|uniref:GAR domain-containing protein n=1 Tax=Prymnesium parvum TaxID=97485 RepID=A0AB34K2L5_PRYPA
MAYHQFSVPESDQLTDPSALTEHLYAGAAHVRGRSDGTPLARLLEAAAQAIQRQVAEAKVQRGLAIASQTIASELALKCEQLQQRLEGHAGEVPSARLDTRGASPLLLGGYAGAPGPIVAPPASSPASPDVPPPPWGAQPPQPPPPSMLPIRADSGASPPAAPAAYLQQAQPPSMYSAAPPAASPAPARAAAAAENASDRLGPRAFKTWVPDPVQPQGNGVGAPRHGQEPPPPDPETERQVDSMVENLKLRFKQSGVTLPLEKTSGCVYRLGSRKLALNIRNNRLMVRVGNGYCDFLEYLSKATL